VCRRKPRPKRPPGERYDTKSYYRAVDYAIERAVAANALAREHRWYPHRLRHSAATLIRKQFGLDAARAVLGQKSLAIADTYAQIDGALAAKVAASVG
jgi:integrase